MNYLNKNEFEFCNIIEWHNAGYTGKGVKLAIVEKDLHTDHGRKVLDILKQIVPDCEVKVLLPNLFGVWEYPDFNIVSKSLASLNAPISVAEEELKAVNTLLIAASGNDGEKWMSAYARQNHWVSVGAVHLINGTPKRPSYSSIGEELEVMGFSNLMSSHGRIQGTSFATPFIAGMTALYYQLYKEKFGIFPIPANARGFIKNNTLDLEIEGHDRYTGHGLFILPNVNSIKEGNYLAKNEPNKIILHHSATDDTDIENFDGIKNHHINVNKWADIGYHYVIEKVNGKYVTLKGRDENVAGVHCPGQNSQSIGICLVGDFRKGNPPKDQLEEVAILIKDIYSRHGELPLYKHSDFRPTECPCFDLKLIKDLLVKKVVEVMPEVKWEVKQGLGHLESLVEKSIMKTPDYWKDKMLEPMPVWAILSLIDRITDK